jgi:uroporphyrinogen III methyltransferase/synthase
MRTGKVYLVGAGPGDPGLITVRGLELLRSARVIVYDQLVNPVLLEQASPLAERIFAGKQAGRHCVAQEEINQTLIDYAVRGYEVVRLKGGDPFVFGRGGEEAEALAQAGIPFEIVPGVSSAVAVPAYAGIPLTHRKFASSFAVVTGHETRKAQPSVNWGKLATSVDTLVILMGIRNLRRITRDLVRHGLPSETPVAVIRRGTTESQETVNGTLADIADKAAGIKSPAVIVVGKVVDLRARLDWFGLDAEAPAELWSPARDLEYWNDGIME